MFDLRRIPVFRAASRLGRALLPLLGALLLWFSPVPAQAQSCDPGEVRCGNGCMPVGSICCGSCGSNCGRSCPTSHPVCGGQSGCPEGSCCERAAPPPSGGGGCSGNQVRCGNGCMQRGDVCCGSCGADCGRSCDAAYPICGGTQGCPEGSCCQPGGGSGGGGSGGGGGGSGGGSGAGWVCSSDYVDGAGSCDVRFCANYAQGASYYEVDGARVNCDGPTADYACIDRAAALCAVGCTNLGPGARPSAVLLLAGLLLLRRRRRGAAARVGLLVGVLGVGGVACDDGLSGEAADSHLTSAIFIPDDGAVLEDPEVDESIDIGGGAGSGMRMELMPGGMVSVTLPFSAPQGNVVGAGIRFGSSGPVRTVPIPGAQGQQSGMLRFAFQLPDGICDDLSSICHDIKCYEFAVTDAGRVSRANINDIAMACGSCDEPSCQDLLDRCYAPPSGGTTCSSDFSAGAVCGNANLDFCIDTDSQRCWYEVGGRRFDCGSCQSINGCAQAAVDYCIGN